MAIEWETYGVEDNGGTRFHWYPREVDAGGDREAYRWSIIRTKRGFYILDDPYPDGDISSDELIASHGKGGPFPKLNAAKVALLLQIAQGNVEFFRV